MEIAKEVTERKKRIEKYKDRALEKEDSSEVIETKAKQLAWVISNARHLIVYSGAGISTSAKIPDYRGPQGENFITIKFLSIIMNKYFKVSGHYSNEEKKLAIMTCHLQNRRLRTWLYPHYTKEMYLNT